MEEKTIMLKKFVCVVPCYKCNKYKRCLKDDNFPIEHLARKLFIVCFANILGMDVVTDLGELPKGISFISLQCHDYGDACKLVGGSVLKDGVGLVPSDDEIIVISVMDYGGPLKRVVRRHKDKLMQTDPKLWLDILSEDEDVKKFLSRLKEETDKLMG